MIRRFTFGVAASSLALVLAGCAVGSGDAASSEAGGSRLVPTFKPDRHPDRHRQDSTSLSASAAPRAASSPKASVGGESPTAGTASAAAPPSSTSSPAPAAPATSPGSLKASITDGSGDVSGLGAPAYVDLAAVTMSRHGDRFSVRIEVAGTLPSRQDDDRTTNAACFVDTDGDGSVDYEMWANLSGTGWGSSYRYPSGARFGESSGVSVAAHGHTLTLGFPASHVGGASSFRWATGTEYGTVEQVAAGTTARDLAPDGGAVRFPGQR